MPLPDPPEGGKMVNIQFSIFNKNLLPVMDEDAAMWI